MQYFTFSMYIYICIYVYLQMPALVDCELQQNIEEFGDIGEMEKINI